MIVSVVTRLPTKHRCEEYCTPKVSPTEPGWRNRTGRCPTERNNWSYLLRCEKHEPGSEATHGLTLMVTSEHFHTTVILVNWVHSRLCTPGWRPLLSLDTRSFMREWQHYMRSSLGPVYNQNTEMVPRCDVILTALKGLAVAVSTIEGTKGESACIITY
jgi:hypothetical protein